MGAHAPLQVAADAPLLVAADLDGTMVGDREALADLNAALAPRRDVIRLAYVTGRTHVAPAELAPLEGLLAPDALITGVGTCIRLAPGWEPDARWERAIAAGWSAERVSAVAGFFPALRPQPLAAQGPYKRSYHLDAADGPATLAALARALHAHRVRARLVYSGARDLDVVPWRAGKGRALAYLAAAMGIPLGHVVACGDSGNDLDMIRVSGRAVVVGNAGPELALAAPPGVVRAARPYAGGVLEGLRALGVLS